MSSATSMMKTAAVAVLFCLALLAHPADVEGQSSSRRSSARPLAALIAEMSDLPRATRCGVLETVRDPLTSEAIVQSYQSRRSIPDEPAARAIVTALFDYMLAPSAATRGALLQQHVRAGALPGVAEDIIHCSFGGDWQTLAPDERLRRTLEVPPASVGLFWAARLSQSTSDRLAYYERALEAETSNPRTRIFYAIALIQAGRGADALRVLDGIPAGWAPDSTTYWRGRALMQMERWQEARSVLERLPPVFRREETKPDAWTDRQPVRGESPRLCALYFSMAMSGDRRRAIQHLRGIPGCADDLARLELIERPFEALVATLSGRGGAQSPELRLRAMSRLGACGWALDWLASNREPYWDRIRPEVEVRCGRKALAEERVEAALAARLATPRLRAYEERPMPPEWLWSGERPGRPASVPYPPLKAFTIRSISPPGDRMFAVSASDDVDPGAEGPGAYWLHLSADGGRTWNGPYYLGLAGGPFYRVHGASRVSPFLDGRLLLEATPEVSTAEARTRRPQPVVLAIDVDVVRRDSDGDGLTDLLEERLLLDPHARDTDGDGLDDRTDPLPLLARDDYAQLQDQRLWVTLFAKRRETQQQRPLRTLFLVSDGCPVPHAAGVRTICLSRTLVERYQEKLGPISPVEVWMAFDTQHRRAVILSEGGHSGQLQIARWRNGNWTLQRLTSWMY